MIDRAIGIAGLALALVFGVAQYYLPTLPAWVSYSGMAIGIFLLGVSCALILPFRRDAPKAPPPVDRALLRLHVYADHRTPERLAAENIFRWYYLKTDIQGVVATGEQTQIAAMVTLFVAFDPDVRITNLRLRSPDIRLPRHEVKEFNQRFAIISIFGDRS